MDATGTPSSDHRLSSRFAEAADLYLRDRLTVRPALLDLVNVQIAFPPASSRRSCVDR